MELVNKINFVQRKLRYGQFHFMAEQNVMQRIRFEHLKIIFALDWLQYLGLAIECEAIF